MAWTLIFLPVLAFALGSRWPGALVLGTVLAATGLLVWAALSTRSLLLSEAGIDAAHHDTYYVVGDTRSMGVAAALSVGLGLVWLALNAWRALRLPRVMAALTYMAFLAFMGNFMVATEFLHA